MLTLGSARRAAPRLLVVALLALLVGACGSSSPSHGDLPKAGVACSSLSPTPAIVTDLDGTMTLSDAEFLQQFADATYVPKAWPDAAALMVQLYDRGYRILYLTARAETLTLMSGETFRAATEEWLTNQGFPMDPQRTEVVLAPDGVSGDATIAYKLGALQQHQAAGWEFHYAYGNATTDIAAYLQAGIPPADIFIIGGNTGLQGTTPVTGDGWTDHLATVITPTGRICDF